MDLGKNRSSDLEISGIGMSSSNASYKGTLLPAVIRGIIDIDVGISFRLG
jgi:hypothetical protein